MYKQIILLGESNQMFTPTLVTECGETVRINFRDEQGPENEVPKTIDTRVARAYLGH